ncbi:aldose epimerase family protein [Streptomyces sp. NBC_00691]|uniref:aldose epimerase family protein n=1 Tax=Streptomyces sp. NBC_00691 TaxID=2903671 RepID=UPI002E2F1B92|nr:aldose epimerase family protein [Streptomyces sp. NBC_00691]
MTTKHPHQILPPVSEPFGRLADGTEIRRWSLGNGGTRLSVLSYGGIVQSLETPDRHGRHANVSLGFGSLDGYLASDGFLGALVGRYGNRIAESQFKLDGTRHFLSAAGGKHTLHGGADGFDRRVWTVHGFARGGDVGLILTLTSPDGDMGFPGALRVRVVYTLTASGAWRVDYEAVTDKPTVVNLTSHVYWNLAGESSGSALDHELSLAASRMTPVRTGLIPTGRLAPVAGTPFDFRRPTPVGSRIDADSPQLRHAGGYDHNWVLDKGVTATPRPAATLRDPGSGRVMRVSTTEPGIQFYSGNSLDGSPVGSGGRAYRRRDGLCLETQHFPDAPNQPAFPSTVLRPGEAYRSSTVHAFAVT